MNFNYFILLSYARCNMDIFSNQMNDHWDSSDYEYDRKRNEDKWNLEAIIINNNIELPWGENATIDDIADSFHTYSPFYFSILILILDFNFHF